MPHTPEEFDLRINRLKADMCEQGRRVTAMAELSVEALFDGDPDKAERVVRADAVIDRVDVEAEKAAVRLLHDVAHQVAALDDHQLRMVLTIVKVNNELERIADLSVDIAQLHRPVEDTGCSIPPTFRVMANSVLGVLQTTNRCFERLDTRLAREVLASDYTVDEFERILLRENQTALAAGTVSVDAALTLHTVAGSLERINDHCSNIAEQVIYVESGSIVRHQGGQWIDPKNPEAG